MKYSRDVLPGLFVQSINRIFGCPFNILIQPDKDYPPIKGEDEKFYVRITAKDIAIRNHCEKILKALDLRVVRLVADEVTLHCIVYASEIIKIHEALPSLSKSCASKLEGFLKRLFKEVKFDSSLTDTTIEYIAAVHKDNIRSFLQVLNNLGIDNWELVDKNTAVAFTLSKV